MYYNIHAFTQRDYHTQLAHHYRMNTIHHYILAHYKQLNLQRLPYMSSAVVQRPLVHMLTACSELWHYVSAYVAVFSIVGWHHTRLLHHSQAA